MNQIVHIFRKDCRRLWQIIAAVLLFTFLHGYGDATDLGGGRAVVISPGSVVLILISLSGLILPVLFFLLVVSVIQEESLVGSEKFWLTRPYDRVSLFVEKFLFVALWAFLPMLLHDVFLIHHLGFSLSSAFGLLLWKNAQFGFFLLVAAMLAVLSASFARAVLLAIGSVLVIALIFSAVSQDAVSPWTANYEILAVLAVGAVSALCMIVFQYRFRITPVAVVIGVVAIVVCALLARFWPPSLSAYLLQKNESPLLRSVQVLPDADLKDIPRPPQLLNPTTQPPAAYYPFRASGLSDNVGVDLIGLSARLDSPPKKSASLYLAAVVRFQPNTIGSAQFADAGSPAQLVSLAPPNPEDYERLKDTDGTLSGNVVLQGFRSAVARVPVPPPARNNDLAIGDRRCRVWSFLRGSNLEVNFKCVELEPGNTTKFQVRLLKNSREIIQSGPQGQPARAGGWPPFLSPIVTTYSYIEFEAPASAEGLIDGSTSGLEMLVFAEQSLGAVTRDFRIDHVRAADLTLQAWEQRGVVKPEAAPAPSTGETVSKPQ